MFEAPTGTGLACSDYLIMKFVMPLWTQKQKMHQLSIAGPLERNFAGYDGIHVLCCSGSNLKANSVGEVVKMR